MCCRPLDVARCRDALAGTDVLVGTVIGFPHGSHLTATKVFEADRAIEQGAVELDMVINIGWLRSGEDRLRRVTTSPPWSPPPRRRDRQGDPGERLPRPTTRRSRGCRLVEAAGADYVKTSTGFAPSGATLDDLRLMRATVSPHVKVKAAGGVRTLDALIDCLNAGIDRCGATAHGRHHRRPPAPARPSARSSRWLGLDLGGTNIKVAVLDASRAVGVGRDDADRGRRRAGRRRRQADRRRVAAIDGGARSMVRRSACRGCSTPRPAASSCSPTCPDRGAASRRRAARRSPSAAGRHHQRRPRLHAGRSPPRRRRRLRHRRLPRARHRHRGWHRRRRPAARSAATAAPASWPTRSSSPAGRRAAAATVAASKRSRRPGALAAPGRGATAEDVFAAARRGDERAAAAIETVADHLGAGLANVIPSSCPERIVIGGGVAAAGDALLDPIRAAVRRHNVLVPDDWFDIVPGALGPDAGAIGAALWAADQRSVVYGGPIGP